MKKRNLLLLVGTTLLTTQGVLPSMVRAEEVRQQSVSDNDIIKVIDPYIEEDFYSYRISNEKELMSKIGIPNYMKLQSLLTTANKRKRAALKRSAISYVHSEALRMAGATVENHWWGKRIRIRNIRIAKRVQELAKNFSIHSSKESVIKGVSSIFSHSIKSLFQSGVEMLNSDTWSKISREIERRKYYGSFYIDVNDWDTGVSSENER